MKTMIITDSERRDILTALLFAAQMYDQMADDLAKKASVVEECRASGEHCRSYSVKLLAIRDSLSLADAWELPPK